MTPTWWDRVSSKAPDSHSGTEETAAGDLLEGRLWCGHFPEDDCPCGPGVTSCPTCDGTDPDVIHLGDLMPGCDDGPEGTDSCDCGASDATVPLAEQIAQYGIMAEEVLDALHDNLEDEWFRRAVIRLGVERLTEGYEEFGSAMYQWSADHRDDEMFQEISDYVVYGTSGDYFRVTP